MSVRVNVRFRAQIATVASCCVVAATLAINDARVHENLLWAQSIIQEDASEGNSFQSFSSRNVEKIAALPGDSSAKAGARDLLGAFDPARRANLAAAPPTGRAKQIDGLSYRIPFSFPKSANANGATSVELYVSQDAGQTWYSYATALATDNRDAFFFQAPVQGEYWFVLKTNFGNGKSALSSTRAYAFSAPEQENETFELRDDSLEIDPQPSLDPSFELDVEPSPLDSTGEDEEAFVLNNASVALEDQPPATAPQNKAPKSDEPEIPPHPGKLKSLSFGREDQSERLMITARWFRPEEIDEEFRIDVKSFNIERAPSPQGPWTIVGEELDVKQKGYAWIAVADEMKPFYVRTVVVDSNGNVWRDVTTAPMDVSQREVRAALGPVKTPAPFPSEKKDDDESQNEKPFIRNTASQEEQEESIDADKLVSPRDVERNKKSDKLVSGVDAREPTPKKRRPYVPAPTDPNEFQINPIFTKGFGVLDQAAQTRAEPSSSQKRSIFTPPERAQRVAAVRPPEMRKSAAQLAATRARIERQKLEEQARYNQEHEMEAFEQKPELMEGRMFYIDSNGNMTTTPPPEMRQALASNADLIAQGWVPVDQGNANSFNGANNAEPIYMPRDVEEYDASARSGAATYQNREYPNASNPGASPINNRYSDGAANSTTIDDSRAIPQTSFSPTYSTIPANAFPPQPRSSF